MAGRDADMERGDSYEDADDIHRLSRVSELTERSPSPLPAYMTHIARKEEEELDEGTHRREIIENGYEFVEESQEERSTGVVTRSVEAEKRVIREGSRILETEEHVVISEVTSPPPKETRFTPWATERLGHHHSPTNRSPKSSPDRSPEQTPVPLRYEDSSNLVRYQEPREEEIAVHHEEEPPEDEPPKVERHGRSPHMERHHHDPDHDRTPPPPPARSFDRSSPPVPRHEVQPDHSPPATIQADQSATTVVINREPPSTPTAVIRHDEPTLAAQEQQEQQEHPQPMPAPRGKKHVTISFPSFGRRRSHSGGDAGHDEGHGPRGSAEESVVHITMYPRYVMRPLGILRIIQILFGIIVCAATNASQCWNTLASFGYLICSMPTSQTFSGEFSGQGYVLFVGIVFILGNFVWIGYHLVMRPPTSTATYDSDRYARMSRIRMAELIYDGAAVVLYIIAASVSAWYASMSYMEWPKGQTRLPNPYKPQWICATIFAWFNVILYVAQIVCAQFFA